MLKIKKNIYMLMLLIITIFTTSCGESEVIDSKDDEAIETINLDYSEHKLPNKVKWITNTKFKTFSSPNAKKGGTFKYYIASYPLTFRNVGPDSNTSTRSYFNNNNMGLLEIHPNTEEIIPSLATHWAYAKDGKTMYFKLDKNARWSDGKPVTADDFIYTIEFMRSKYITAPWYNNYYTNEIDKVIKYDNLTISVTAKKKLPDLWMTVSITPTPKHFYGKLTKNFVKKYNWEIVPNTGPYILKKFKKMNYLIFERKQDWWAKDYKYYKNRYNVDKFKLIVVKDQNVAFANFQKNEIDSFLAAFPSIWYNKGKGKLFDNGYVHKITFYTDARQPTRGFRLNLDKEIFKDINLRYAFAHSINFDKLNKKILRNDYERLHAYNTGYGKYTNKKIRARKYNIKKVEYYMKKSGWKRGKDGIWEKGGKRYSVTISYGSALHDPKMIFLKEEAKKAGIELILELLDAGAWYKKGMEKKHEISFGALSTSFRPSYWQVFHSENAHKPQTNNSTNTDDPEMDKLIDAYRTSTLSNQRIKLSHKIQKKIHDISAWVPLYQVPYTRQFYWRWIKFPKVAASKNSSSVAIDPTGLGLFWIDAKIKEETLKAMKEGKTFKPVKTIDKTYKAK